MDRREEKMQKKEAVEAVEDDADAEAEVMNHLFF